MRTFIAFSKSESSKISIMPSMRAADVAWSTSRPPLKPTVGPTEVFEGDEGFGSGSPRSMKTSHTRNWAGNGIE